ncbi:MAG: sensor histidine kinase [Acidimicrobiia bacterium]
MSRVLAPAISATRRWAHDRRVVVDLLVAGLILVLSLLDMASTEVEPGDREVDVGAYALIAVGATALMWRRYVPEVVLACVTVVLIVFWTSDYGSFVPPLGLSALYAVAVHSEHRRRAWSTVAVAVVVLMAAASVSILDEPEGFAYANGASMAVFLAGSIAVGLVIRNRERIFVDTQRRADQAEADRLAEAERAVARERLRIAREMHDVVAHGMSVVSVQAAAAREIVHTDPDRTAEVLERIEAVSRESLIEMRRMLGVLRNTGEPDTSLLPQPTLRDVAAAVAHSVESGVVAELVVTGQARTLPPGIELAAFRVVQEALTNVLKHAGPSASATVTIDYRPDDLEVSVIDDGRGSMSALSESGGGNGLIGMRERVDAYGGVFAAGPRAGGGYGVRVVLPLDNQPSRPSVGSVDPELTESPS